MKFAMYVINCETQEVYGSNDADAIGNYIQNNEEGYDPDAFLIIHSTYGDVQTIDNNVASIEEVPEIEEEDDDPSEDQDGDESQED